MWVTVSDYYSSSGKFRMVVLDENIFAYDTLDSTRKQMKSEMAAHRFEYESDFAKFLNKELGCSSSSDDGDGGSGSRSDDGDGDGDGEGDVGGDGDGENEEEEDEGQMDTHLMMFLENIEADGASYVLKRDGKPDLKFEGMDEDGDGSCCFDGNEAHVVDRIGFSSDCESEQRRRGGNDVDVRSQGRRDKGILRGDGGGNSRNVKENGKVDRRAKDFKNVGKKQTFVGNDQDLLVEEVDVMTEKRGGKTVKNVGSGKDRMVENVDLRSVSRRERDVKNVENKQTLMENKKDRSVEQVDLTQVKRREKNVKNVEKQKSFVEYESDSSEVDIRRDGIQFSRYVKMIGKLERKEKNVKNVEKQKSFMKNKRNNSVKGVNLRPDGRQFWRDVKENGKLERRANNVKNLKKEKNFMENERDSSPLGKVSLKKKWCLSENISAMEIDPDYKMFFDQCELEEGTLVLVANGKRLKYGEDDNKSLSDSEVYVLDHAPDCMESNYAPTFNFDAHMEDDDLQCLGSCNQAENPLFRKAVMDILRKPFDYKEYRRLRKDVKQRKLIKRHVDMRSGNTSFQQSTMGKSYLDHYADLKKQFDAFKNDIPKRLNILRGFFFYLKRMADDGKFKPWLDDSCLAIIPRTG